MNFNLGSTGLRWALASVVTLSWAGMAWAVPQKGSELIIYGLPPSASGSYTEGGEGFNAVQHAETWNAGSPFAPWNPMAVTAEGLARADQGLLGASVLGTATRDCGSMSCSAGSPYGMVRVRLWDTFTIGPGGEFAPGDAVKIRSVLSLDGSYMLTGAPSDGSEWWYDVRLGTLGVGTQELYQLSLREGLLPPTIGVVGPLRWDPVLDVQVGQKVYLWAELLVHLGGNSLSAFPNGTYDSFLDFLGTGKAGLGYVSGYEGISITSAAGAPIAAVPEPSTYVTLVFGLGLVGWRLRGQLGKSLPRVDPDGRVSGAEDAAGGRLAG